MKTTKYKCDRCKREDETNKIGLHKIGIHIDIFTMMDWGDKVINNEWCEKCIEEFFPDFFLRRKIDDDFREVKAEPTVIEQIIKFIKR